ncbi:MAG: hypothetical protein JF599_07955 [Verrucomicrobia bacterium]|nr:hypothetical protein [Verrucomicrobiota bacterium]
MSISCYGLLLVLFVLTPLGLGWPLAVRCTKDPLEQVCAALLLGFVFCFLITFGLYASGLPWAGFALVPVVAMAGLCWRRAAIRSLWRDDDARHAIIGCILVMGWTQALALLVRSYNGGAWGVDWLEHHQRALFFREHWDYAFDFFGYQLPVRPPFANLTVAGFETLTYPTFACDQVVLALWSSFVFLPAALFCRRAGGARHLPVLVGLLLLNPSFVQNATFAWTKLPAAFFVLTSAHFFLEALNAPERRAYFALFVTALTAAMLTHYSAGPYCVIFAGWWLLWRLHGRAWSALRVEAVTGALIAIPLLGLWLGWALDHYGVTRTFFVNSTTINSGPPGWDLQLARIGRNLWATLIPHPLRSVDYSFIAQPSRLGWFRDYFFLIVQVNLPALLGTGGLVALACATLRDWKSWARQTGVVKPVWVLTALAACSVLGVAVHGAPDEWGLAHICLQPLALVGLALLAARIDRIGRIGGLILGVGLAWDAGVNIGLHFLLEARAPAPEWLALHNPTQALLQYGPAALNASLKDVAGVRFLHDWFPGFAAPLILLAIVLMATAVWLRASTQYHRSPAAGL